MKQTALTINTEPLLNRTFPVFAEIARRRQGIRKVLESLTPKNIKL